MIIRDSKSVIEGAYKRRHKTLFLVRGAPGSGKTTYAKRLPSDLHVEADMYHDSRGGFKPENLPAAHEWCRNTVENGMKDSLTQIVVSNTFIRNWEMEPYIDLADKYGYNIKIATMLGRWQNVRGVPSDKVEEMRNNIEPVDCGYRWKSRGAYLVRVAWDKNRELSIVEAPENRHKSDSTVQAIRLNGSSEEVRL